VLLYFSADGPVAHDFGAHNFGARRLFDEYRAGGLGPLRPSSARSLLLASAAEKILDFALHLAGRGGPRGTCSSLGRRRRFHPRKSGPDQGNENKDENEKYDDDFAACGKERSLAKGSGSEY
jgi:hypothetical protein